MPDRQPELLGFRQIDLDLLNINNGRREQGLDELAVEDLLPPQPDHWPTVEELREAAAKQSRRGMVCEGRGVRITPQFELIIGPGGWRRNWPRIKNV